MTAKERHQNEIFLHGKGAKAWYNEVYLLSQHWHDLRKAKMTRDGKKCQRCPCKKKLQVHHHEYRNIYDVTLDDLEVLCPTCHKIEHGVEIRVKMHEPVKDPSWRKRQKAFAGQLKARRRLCKDGITRIKP